MDNRVRKLMETRLNHDSDRLELLEKQLREARELAAESDRKFEEVIPTFISCCQFTAQQNTGVNRKQTYSLVSS